MTSLVLILVIAGLFASNLAGIRRLFPHNLPPREIHSLAVLPLINISADPEQEYFVDGMTEQLIKELSQLNSLRVPSRTSVMRYKGEKRKNVSEIARELGVDAVVEGSVVRSGHRVRITAQVIEAATEQHLLSESYERDLGDILKLQREVAEAITQQVRVKLTPEQIHRLHEPREVDPEAYEAYLKALSFDRTRHREIQRAQSYLEKAIQKQPDFTQAYVELARSYRNLGQFGWLAPQIAYPRAKEATHKALDLDAANCEAHWSLAWLNWQYEWDWASAEREMRSALELCPNSAALHQYRGHYVGWKGASGEARAEFAKSHELDPLMADFLIYEAVTYYHSRDFEAMIELGQRQTISDPNSWLGHYCIGTGRAGLGRFADAIPEFEKAVQLSDGDRDPSAALAHAYAATGRAAEAKGILQGWQRRSGDDYVSPYMIATVLAGLGEKEQAFEFLERAYQERSSDLLYFLRADARIDSLRSDVRFEHLMRRMNLGR